MNRNFRIMVIFLLFLSSCCKEGTEVNQYLLTDSEKADIPYLTNDIIKFNHTNGFEFDMVVTGKQTEWRTTETQHCGDNWSKYESLIISLNSSTPELHIKLEVFPKEIDQSLIISINNKSQFQLNLQGAPNIDTLTVNGTTFSNIYQADSFWSDTLVIRPEQILYSKEVGIIQITMSDDERFTINE